MRNGGFKNSYHRSIPILAWTFGAILILVTVISFITTARNAGSYFVEYETRELTDAMILRAQEVIKNNSRAGIDLDQMVSFDKVLFDLIRDRQEVAFMALLGKGGRLLAFAGHQRASPEDMFSEIKASIQNKPVKRFILYRSYVYSDQGSMGSIVVGVDLYHIYRTVFLIAIDCFIAALVAAVIIRETTRIIVPDLNTGPVQKLPNRISDSGQYLVIGIRLISFLVAFSEELIRPFLSIYIGENLRSNFLDSPTLFVSSTLSIFMICYAAAQFIGPFLARQWTLRSVLCVALFIMSIGAALFALSNNWLVAFTGRAFAGIGFGIVLIIGQAAILHGSDSDSRIRDVGNVAAAMVAAGLCGPLVGGLLADHFGYQFVLITACIVTLVALFIGINISRRNNLITVQKYQVHTKEKIKDRLLHRSTLFLITFAIPIRIVAAAMLIYLAPLTVIRDGESLTMAGRIIALYFVGYLIARPLGSRLLSMGISPTILAIITCIINAIACYINFSSDVSLFAISISMILFGCAHALSNTAQLTFFFNIANVNKNREKEADLLGFYRLAERIGAAIGPPLCVFIDSGGGLKNIEAVMLGIAIFTMLATNLIIISNRVK